MADDTPIAVTSRSFSKHPVLRAELLDRYADVRFNDEGASLRGDTLAEFLAGRVKAITALEPIDGPLLDRLPDLRVISKVGVGLDMIDLGAVDRRGVRLAFTRGTNRRSVSELALALMLALLRRLPEATALAAAGEWRQLQGRTLSGRTVGIVGFGAVGRDLALLLAPFGCEIVVSDIREVDGFRQLELDDLLAAADVVSLHLELTDSTRGLIDRRRLELMKPGAVLVNTARGGLVDEDALCDFLAAERLSAALDVLALEPPGDTRLLTLPNAIVTPHVGGSTAEAVLAMGRAAIAGLDG